MVSTCILDLLYLIVDIKFVIER